MHFLGAVLAELFPRSSRSHAQLFTIALCVLCTGALGTSTAVAVAASPVCSQFVRTYADHLKRNVVSSATLRHWREWGVKHPNWHPSLNAPKRPKFLKVREEKVSRMQLACPIITSEVALVPADLDNFILPQPTPTFEQALNAPTSAPLQAFQTPFGGTASTFASPGGGGGIGGGAGPIGSAPTSGPVASSPTTPSPISEPVPITPVTPVSPAPVPEPNSIILTLTGMTALAAFALYSRRQAMPRHSA